MTSLTPCPSILVPTRNEERNLPACLKSVAWCDDVVVFDSFSSDATVSLAEQQGARVVQRTFDNFASHKNWAISHVEFRHEWILILDADERITPELAHEIQALLTSSPRENGFYVARQNWFAGHWIRHGGWYPNWNLRLFRRGKAQYEPRIVHEHMVVEGEAGFLKNPLVHYDYKGIERYIERHNTYSSMEAVEVFRTLHGKKESNTLKGLLWARGPERRRFLKNLAYRYLPARSFLKFLWMYIIQLGFLDGRAGFRYCLLHSIYEYQISLKLLELSDPKSAMTEKYSSYLGDSALAGRVMHGD